LAGQFHGLGGGHDAELFAVGADQAHGTDADLLVDPLVRLPIMLRVTVAGTNTLASLSCTGNTTTEATAARNGARQSPRIVRRVAWGACPLTGTGDDAVPAFFRTGEGAKEFTPRPEHNLPSIPIGGKDVNGGVQKNTNPTHQRGALLLRAGPRADASGWCES